MDWFIANWEVIGAALVAVLSAAAVIVKLTPSTTDDEWIEKIKEVVEKAVAKKVP
jgi:uncharacterized membrane-anchored protein YhcB (DUF1043 family)